MANVTVIPSTTPKRSSLEILRSYVDENRHIRYLDLAALVVPSRGKNLTAFNSFVEGILAECDHIETLILSRCSKSQLKTLAAVMKKGHSLMKLDLGVVADHKDVEAFLQQDLGLTSIRIRSADLKYVALKAALKSPMPLKTLSLPKTAPPFFITRIDEYVELFRQTNQTVERIEFGHGHCWSKETSQPKQKMKEKSTDAAGDNGNDDDTDDEEDNKQGRKKKQKLDDSKDTHSSSSSQCTDQ
eukprot:TRINITY_DN15560_c0_g1_i1.p1 TRINITY_DN15560_c0_g1~~TRINITY_DN15560_c0_g1_i1.p1  ORF type:complete len:243 (-),score=20.14 TRINITY_DN15560_c0_g1_i1:63-791(-)